MMLEKRREAGFYTTVMHPLSQCHIQFASCLYGRVPQSRDLREHRIRPPLKPMMYKVISTALVSTEGLNNNLEQQFHGRTVERAA